MTMYLRTFLTRPSAAERTQIRSDPDLVLDVEREVVDRGGNRVELTAASDLMAAFRHRYMVKSDSADRVMSDAWLAPRLHWALRLTRRQAAGKDLWLWFALRHSDYVSWRWGVAAPENRWIGPVNKQAFARLWWAAELLRTAGDYSPVTRGFEKQDFVNSFLHRPVMRNRPIAQATVERLFPAGREVNPSSDEVNLLAKVIGLLTAGIDPAIEVPAPPDDVRAYTAWRLERFSGGRWTSLPPAPRDAVVEDEAFERAEELLSRWQGFVIHYANYQKTRSGRRLTKRLQGSEEGKP